MALVFSGKPLRGSWDVSFLVYRQEAAELQYGGISPKDLAYQEIPIRIGG
jgi:hypothetical protein